MKKTIILSALLIVLCACAPTQQENNLEETTLQYEKRLNEEVFVVENRQIPLALKEPQHNIEYFENRKDTDVEGMADEISTYADALLYLLGKDYNGREEELTYVFAMLLEKDYEEIRVIRIYVQNEYHFVLAIKANNKYYLMDPPSDYNGRNYWLENYSCEEGAFNNIDELISTLYEAYPINGVDSVICVPKEPDGKKMELIDNANEPVYEYKGHDYYLGYGAPLLSDEEINELVKEYQKGNYDLIKDKISTIPDMVYFCESIGFKSAGWNNIVSTSNYSGPDVGNIVYNDDIFCYSLSGKEILMLNEGQCSATATLLDYLLKDDYDEVGYVAINFLNNDNGGKTIDGHVINYIKNEDSYYLISPSYYIAGDNIWEKDYDFKGGFSSLEEAMEKLNASDYPNGKVVATAAFEYDGIYMASDNRSSNKITNRVFPEGADVKVCLGTKYSFSKPKHPSNQDYVLGVVLK